MRKLNRIISMLLAIFMVIGSLTAMFSVQVFAADDANSNEDKDSSETEPPKIEAEEEIDYTQQIYVTPEEKLKTMTLAFKNSVLGYELWVDYYSGEVACVNTITGEKLFTNPYDVGATTGSDKTKYELLSQIIVNFTDNQGQEHTFLSFEEAVLRDQIDVENIKNGIRVEYTIGREQSKTLVPRLISKERFDELILAPLIETFGDALYEPAETEEMQKIQGFLAYYMLFSKEKLDMTEDEKYLFNGVYDNLIESDREFTLKLKEYPVIDRMPVYAFSATAGEAEIARCEELILTYCPEYTYEELEFDHTLTEYVSDDENPPVFRMALEYKIEADGLSVRLPANGIRFNESLYTLENIEVLPYMGAGNRAYEGYTFFPDGSGALLDFVELRDMSKHSVVGQVYGPDFAYHHLADATYQKHIRFPVFGIVENTNYYTYTKYDIDDPENVVSQTTIAGNIVDVVKQHNEGGSPSFCLEQVANLSAKYKDTIYNKDAEETVVEDKRGFVAIIEEGDALVELSAYHPGVDHDYNTMKMTVTPRPKDSYNLQDSISVGANSDWTVVCERKYVGTYKIKYIMLTDTPDSKLVMPEGESADAYDTYDTSWLGMAIAYRNYLDDKGIISQLQADELTTDIPLYIETFGAVETTKKILSVPVDVMESLTTFDEVLEMYKYLSGEGIKNINFKLTGYANGGMYYAVPGHLRFERVVGGKSGFQKLLDEAAKINAADKDSNLGIFPDFDIVYQIDDDLFNGYQQFDHAAKTIDDRYATRREYSATQQKYINYYEIVISSAYFDVIYNRITKNYAKSYKNVHGISVSTLGQWLHSDFDEDEPYNREDSKKFTIEAFQHLDDNYSEVMTSGGNAYVWKYVDHMLDVSLDSSRYVFSSNAVPFIGVVLHGSVSFTGEPLNMEGDIQYAILKAIENGASPYFILSMDNTHVLKEYFDLSQYYSIRYDIWKEDIADVYNTLNNVLFDVQDKYIIGHNFLTGNRIPDSDELEADIYNEYLKDLAAEKNAADILAAEIALSASAARENGKMAEKEAAKALLLAFDYYKNFSKDMNGSVNMDERYYGYSKAAYIANFKATMSGDEAQKALTKTILDAVTNNNIPAEYFTSIYDEMLDDIAKLDSEVKAAQKAAMKAAVLAELKTLFTDDADAEKIATTIIDTVLADGFNYGSIDKLVEIVNGLIEKPDDVSALTDKYYNELIALIVGEVEAIKAEIEADKAAAEGEATEDKTDEYKNKLTNAIKSNLNRVLSGEKAGTLAASIAEAIVGKGIETATAADIETLVEAKVNEFYASDANASVEVETALYNSFVSNLSKRAVYTNIKIEGGKNQIVDLYDRYRSEITANGTATLPVISAELEAFADAYMKTVAAKSAMQLMIKAGFSSDLGESLAKYTESYMNNYEEYKNIYFQYEMNTNYFKNMKALAISENASAEVVSLYDRYIKADKDKIALEKSVNNGAKKTRGTIDNYVEALAKLGALTELGFEGNEDAYTVTKDAEGNVISTVTKAQVYKDAKDLVNSVRTTALSTTAGLGSSNYSYIKEQYKATLEYLTIATAAIKVLAVAEGETVEYAEGKEDNIRYITNYDSIKSIIVKQAIDRAVSVADYLEKDRFTPIQVGRETDLTLNGHKLRADRDSSGKTYYFYGTEETGYSYFVYDEKTKAFKVYEGFGSRFGGKITNDKGEELELFEFHETLNGAAVYYTATVEDGFTYYTRDDYKSVDSKGVYVKLDRFITYNGEKFKTTNEIFVNGKFQTIDATDIYYDANANVYYSVNDDGTYSRYTYTDSISSYYNMAVAGSKSTMDQIFDIIANCKVEGSEASLDPAFKESVEKRLPKDDATDDDDDDDKKDEETVSRYHSENIVVVTYGSEMGDPYKSIILNYNNYTVNVVYDHTDDGIDNGIEYTIPAYEFVVIEHKPTND